MKAEELVQSVVDGESVNDVVEKVSNNYDPRMARNYPYAPAVQVVPEDDHEHFEDVDDEDPRTRNHPNAQTHKWPRGSHESNAEKGEPPHMLTPDSMIESVIDGEMPRDVLKRFAERQGSRKRDRGLNEDEE